MKEFRFWSWFRLLIALIVGVGGVFVVPVQAQSGDLQTMAETIATDVGMVVEVADNGSPAPIIIFQETHDSVIGQLEIAVMMNRLYRDFGTRHVGLEGAFERLDTSWYTALPLDPMSKQSVATQHLADGEISSSEWMALVYPDVAVEGIEDEDQYGANEDSAANLDSQPVLIYLLTFASLNMSDAQQEAANQILDNEGVVAFVDYYLSFDAWSKQRYDVLFGDGIVPAEDILQALDDIKARASEIGLDQISDFDEFADGLQTYRLFFELAAQRTDTMVDNVLNLARSFPREPIPMVAGAAHTARILELLDAAGYSYAVLEANALQAPVPDDAEAFGDLSFLAYDRKGQGQSVDGPGRLGAFLDGRDTAGQIKPRSVIDQRFYHLKALTYLAFDRISDVLSNSTALASGTEPVPYGLGDVIDELGALNFMIDPESVEFVPGRGDGDDGEPPSFVFQFTHPADDDGPEITLWAKVAHTTNNVDLIQQLQGQAESDVLEQLLLNAIARLGDTLDSQVETSDETGESVEVAPNPVVNVSLNTIATAATSRATALNQTLGGSE